MSFYTSLFVVGLLAGSQAYTVPTHDSSLTSTYNAPESSDMIYLNNTYGNENGDSLHRGSGR